MIGSHADKQQLWQKRQKNVGVYVGVPCQGFSCEVRCVEGLLTKLLNKSPKHPSN